MALDTLISSKPIDLETLTCDVCPCKSYCKQENCLKQYDSAEVETHLVRKQLVQVVKRYKSNPEKEQAALKIAYKAMIEQSMKAGNGAGDPAA